MSDPHVLTLTGIVQPGPAGAEPQEVLASLAGGVGADGRFRAPQVATAERWLHVTALPVEDESAPDPIETVLASASGGLAELTVLVCHDAASGMRLFVSAGHPAIDERIHHQLAPHCDVSSGTPPVHWRAWPGRGVHFRLQAEVSASAARPTRGRTSGLLERLSSIPDDWAVVLSIRSVHQLEVRDAQDGAHLLGQVAAERLTSTRQESAARSTTTVSGAWTRIQLWLATLLDQLAQGGARGLWKVGTWAFGRDEWTTLQVVAALRGAVPQEEGRRFMAYDAPLDAAAPAEPLSVLTTPEVAAMLAAPSISVPGLAVRMAPPAARRPDRSASPVALGRYWSTNVPALIGLADLEGHAFVTGTTGSGKTTTLHRLLSEVWNRHRIPFLVIDPVKDEYSAVADLFHGGLTVVTGNELSLNLMAAWPGEDSRQHVAQVAQAFRGAFSMPSPTPYVVTQLFDQVAMQSGGPVGAELFDVRDGVDPLVLGLGYAPEAQSNIRAALLTRLNVLLAPTRAHRFAWPDSSMVEELLRRPSVVTLADLVDEEERAFVVLLLALATWSHARSRRAPRPVEHLLVLEEAHRVLPDVQMASAEPEQGSARTVSAQMLTSMLAEVRSYGQQVIVVDQSPSKVATDAIRNTNLKIVHRTVAADDQASVASAIGLPADRAGVLGSLLRGQAIISTRQEPSPQTVGVDPASTVDATARVGKVARNEPSWPCCGGATPERHFRAWRSAGLVESAMAIFVMACRVGDGSHADETRELSLTMLQAQDRVLGARVSCLAWAGLRRLLVAERHAGLLPTARAVAGHLEALYAIWAAEAAPSARVAQDFKVPKTGLGTLCPDCRSACRIRVPAWVHAQHGTRAGITALASASWRNEVTGVGDWARVERLRLTELFGPVGGDTVLRCQVHQAVNRYRLTPDVSAHVLRQAGIIPASKGGKP